MIRPINTVHYTSDFKKSYQKLSQNIQRLVDKKDAWFRKNAFDPRLKTHKLKGELRRYWSYSVTRKYRILFRFVKTDEVIYFDVGTHKIYR